MTSIAGTLHLSGPNPHVGVCPRLNDLTGKAS